jgi:hypothetical protein
MGFNLFGIDILPEDNLFGFWVGSVKNYEGFTRCLFGIYYNDGMLHVDFCYLEKIFYF